MESTLTSSSTGHTHNHQITSDTELLEKSHSFDLGTWQACFNYCEKAAQNGGLNTLQADALLNLYSRGRDNRYSASLSEEAYPLYFHKAVALLKAAAENDGRLLFPLACHYREARRGYQDTGRFVSLLQEAVEQQHLESISLMAWNKYLGIGTTQNQEEAKQMLEANRHKGHSAIDFIYGYMQLVEGNPAGFEELMLQVIGRGEEEKGFYFAAMDQYGGYLLGKEQMEEGFDYIRRAAEGRNSYALFGMGWRHLYGHQLALDVEKGMQLLEESWQLGNAQAAYQLFKYYLQNEQMPAAEEWLKKAVLLNHHDAFTDLARIYLHQYDENPARWAEAIELLQEAAGENNTAALVELAYLHRIGKALEQNQEKALEYLQKAAELNDGYAHYLLGMSYEDGEIGEAPDYEQALTHYKKSAELGHVYGMERAGHYLRIGACGEEQPEEAVKLYHQAIEQGSSYAKIELALCYEIGFGVEENHEEAFKLVNAAAEEGYAHAFSKLGQYYEDGVGVEVDQAKAFENFQQAATHEQPAYLYDLGRCYKYELGTEKDEAKAFELFSKAAEGGYIDAIVELGLCYENGIGVEENQALALKYMLEAAERDHAYAQLKTGVYYLYELPEYDLEKAKHWLHKSAEAGSPFAHLYLGDLYLYSENDEEDAKAFGHYLAAAEQELVSEGLGICYSFGYGTEVNEHEGFKAFMQAAQNDYTKAKYYLALCYKNGDGVLANPQEAAKWMQEAAEEGYVPAQYETAMMYQQGQGLIADQQKALELLRAAAEEEHSAAQFELGNAYLSGLGVEENEDLALEWFSKAADNGNEKALRILGRTK